MHFSSLCSQSDSVLTPTGINLAFVRNHPRDSAIVDAHSGSTLFDVSTKKAFTHSTTTLSTASGQVVAVWEQKALDHDYVTIDGQTSRLSKWLPSKSVWTRCVCHRRARTRDVRVDKDH